MFKSMFKLNTKQIAGIAILTALSVVLAVFTHFPIFPAVSFLEYDMADIPIFLGNFMYGPFAGIIMTILVGVIQGVTVSSGSGIIGILMHIFATGTYVLLSGFIYYFHRTFKGALVAMASGILGWMVGMILWNIILTPIFMGIPREAIFDVLGLIVAFNAIKVGANTIVVFILYKKMEKLFSVIFRTDKGEKHTDELKFTREVENGENVVRVTVKSEKDTLNLGKTIGRELKGGEVILLNGRLGAGKTTFTKGLAQGLNIEKNILSPTFNIMKEYDGRLKLCHFDMYRLESEEETEELGISENLFDPKTVSVIEWNKFENLENVIVIDIEYISENERQFTIRYGVNR